MGIAVFISLCGLIAQAPTDESGLKPYTVRLKSRPEPLHVLAREADLDGVSFKVLIDEPWSTGDPWLRIQRNDVEDGGIEAEESALREDRLRRGWIANGGVRVPTRFGREVWVLKEEKDWADKAQSLARSAYAQVADAAPEGAPLPEAESHRGPGLAQLWAPHAAIAAAAIALAAGVFLALLRKQERWQALDSGRRAPRRR
jgi:hypothetical protein